MNTRNGSSPHQGDWIIEETEGTWEVFQFQGRRGRVFSMGAHALLVVRENARRGGGQVWFQRGNAALPVCDTDTVDSLWHLLAGETNGSASGTHVLMSSEPALAV
jgi:hypothetical protein